jgi:glyoxylase-like metal-dependent hydrolase (beta-lactamase superfamily II)
MKLGDFEVHALNDGFFGLDGGAMFGVVPRPLWEKTNPPDAKNRIQLALRTLLIRGAGRTVLVDTGIGDKMSAKHRDLYAIDQSGGPLVKRLAELGVGADDVTDVVLTHLHFDHAGGATTTRADGTFVPTFPRAKVHVQRANWDWACTPNDREKASYLAENFKPIADAGLLELHDGPFTLLPGLSLLVSDGHTRGQQLVKLSSGGRTILYPGDLVPTSSHLRTAWIMSYDIEPLKVMDEKKRLLEQAANEGWIVCFEHDPKVAACTVSAIPAGFAIGETVAL